MNRVSVGAALPHRHNAKGPSPQEEGPFVVLADKNKDQVMAGLHIT